LKTIFTKIINGELPSHKVAEDDNNIAILDINPNTLGHTLCIPKIQIDKIFDLDNDQFNLLMNFSYKVAKAIKKNIKCKRIAISVIGLEVPHVHVHLIPISNMDDIRFIKKVKISNYEMEKLAKKINHSYKN
jgi:histidine triad (HIT) family protein